MPVRYPFQNALWDARRTDLRHAEWRLVYPATAGHSLKRVNQYIVKVASASNQFFPQTHITLFLSRLYPAKRSLLMLMKAMMVTETGGNADGPA